MSERRLRIVVRAMQAVMVADIVVLAYVLTPDDLSAVLDFLLALLLPHGR
jgi:hypothetical protein